MISSKLLFYDITSQLWSNGQWNKKLGSNQYIFFLELTLLTWYPDRIFQIINYIFLESSVVCCPLG